VTAFQLWRALVQTPLLKKKKTIRLGQHMSDEVKGY
jgi:hypothetical protein